jgi:hypothetical protein
MMYEVPMVPLRPKFVNVATPSVVVAEVVLRRVPPALTVAVTTTPDVVSVSPWSFWSESCGWILNARSLSGPLGARIKASWGRARTVKLKSRGELSVELVAVMTKSVAASGEVGLPVNRPVVVLKLIPAGAAGEMLNDAIAPPMELIVKPEIGLETYTTSSALDSENCGAARRGGVTVRP